MTEHVINGGGFTPGTQEGDPGKLEYLHNANWRGKTRVGADRPLQVDKRACPGCMFPDAKPGKWPHVEGPRCEQWKAEMRSTDIECEALLQVEGL